MLSKKLKRFPGMFLRLLIEQIFCLRIYGKSDPTRLLLVKLDAIGDFVTWLGFADTLRKHYVSQSIVLVCSSLVAEVALESGVFTSVVPINIKKFQTHYWYRFVQLGRIRRMNCSLAIQPTYSRRFLLGESIIRCSGSRHRIGSSGDTSNMSMIEKWLADSWYTQLLVARSDSLSELERHQEFLHHLGVKDSSIQLADLPRAPWPQHVAKPKGSYLVLFPGAGAALRRWPPESFVALAVALHLNHGLQPVICGSAADTPLGELIAEQLGAQEVINLCGATSLLELIGVIEGAELLVANETSASHIAAASGTPSICLLGGGHFGRFMPYPVAAPQPHPVAVYQSMPCFHCNWQCIHSHERDSPVPCIEAITVEMALAAAHQALAFGRRQPSSK